MVFAAHRLNGCNILFTSYEKLLMDKTTLFGVIVSEVITLLGTLFYNTVSGKKTYDDCRGYTILFGYQVLVIVLSMLFAFITEMRLQHIKLYLFA